MLSKIIALITRIYEIQHYLCKIHKYNTLSHLKKKEEMKPLGKGGGFIDFSKNCTFQHNFPKFCNIKILALKIR